MFHPRAHAQATPEKAACVFADATAGQAPVLTYAALESAANRGAQALRRLGLARGEGMALMLDNSVEMVCALHAVWHLGAVCVTINPLTRSDKLQALLASTRTACVMR